MNLLNILIVVWIGITSCGWIYAVRLVRYARQAKLWLIENRLNGYRGIVADGAIHRGKIRVFIFSCMVLMGVVASVTQFYLPGSNMRNVLSGIFRLLFILMALAFTYKTYLERHELDLLVNEDQRRTLKSRIGDTEGEKIER